MHTENQELIFDLHNHTHNSHDGFTTPNELVQSCIIKGINAVAITEHDKECEVDDSLFKKNDIELIHGWECTDNTGAHIIGLFLKDKPPVGEDAVTILKHVSESGGISVMPHPWKKGSGFMAMNGDINLVSKFDFIELINGGWPAGKYSKNILELARTYKLRLLSSSDSHKACQVGLCCTGVSKDDTSLSTYELLSRSTQESLNLYMNKTMLRKRGRRINAFQGSRFYQRVLPFFPQTLRRKIKILRYMISSERFPRQAGFDLIDVKNSQW
jgi:predicted metal-dependent phosphoesterase TrpH